VYIFVFDRKKEKKSYSKITPTTTRRSSVETAQYQPKKKGGERIEEMTGERAAAVLSLSQDLYNRSGRQGPDGEKENCRSFIDTMVGAVVVLLLFLLSRFAPGDRIPSNIAARRGTSSTNSSPNC
jgi:hypothetical protein